MAEAVSLAAQLSRPGDAIILSPGTSSFDMYSGYGQRGDAFRDAVAALN
jgi:UDP-N-acetylmuramoylalanine--D-glutamate ligase